MAETEGVVKYDLEFKEQLIAAPDPIEDLNAWRLICYRLNLIGQDPERYQGYGFGNISQRINHDNAAEPPANQFVISGTQTGAIQTLSAKHYCRVLAADISRNLIVAEGPIKPSSEALTHAAVYAANEAVRFVIHVHSPEVWQHTTALLIPTIAQEITYGTPQMAMAVRQLFESGALSDQGIFSMRGHRDGVVTFGTTAGQAGRILIDYLAQALRAKF